MRTNTEALPHHGEEIASTLPAQPKPLVQFWTPDSDSAYGHTGFDGFDDKLCPDLS